MKTILLTTILFLVGCASIPTPEVKDIAGKKCVKVLKKLGPVTVYSKWEPVSKYSPPKWYEATLKSAAAPAKMLLWIVIPGAVISIALTMVSQCPTVQKRFLTLAMLCGACIPLCWSIMLATANILIFIPLLLVALFGMYYICRKRGLLFSSQEAS